MSRNKYPAIVATAAFSILLLLGINFAFVKPDDLSAGSKLVAYYADDGNAFQIAIGCLSLVVAAGLFLGIQGWLGWELLSRSASKAPMDLAGRAATIAAALMLVAAALWGVAIWNNLYYDGLSGEVTKTLLMLGWLVLAFGGMLSAAFMIATTSFALRSVPGVANWLVILGYVAAALLVLSPMVAPILALPVWMLVMVSRASSLPHQTA